MPKGYEAERVINGTWGELWINGDYVAEVTAFNAKYTLSTSDVNQVGRLTKGTKVMGAEGKGEIKINKIASRFMKLIAANIKAGKTTKATIISKVSDPDSIGTERVVVKDAVFTDLSLADWEIAKLGEETMPFNFTDFEILDEI